MDNYLTDCQSLVYGSVKEPFGKLLFPEIKHKLASLNAFGLGGTKLCMHRATNCTFIVI